LTTEALELIGAYNNKRTISHLGRQNTRQILILVWEMWCSNVCHFDNHMFFISIIKCRKFWISGVFFFFISFCFILFLNCTLFL